MRNKIEVNFSEYDENNYFVSFHQDGQDIGLKFVLHNFVDEMNYWNIPTQACTSGGKEGFLIEKTSPRRLVELEIKRFVESNVF